METSIKRNLTYILNALQEGTHEAQKPILHLMVNETIEDIREHSFGHDFPYTSKKDSFHFKVFTKRSRKAKASILVDMQELQSELTRKHTNVKRCIAVVEKLLNNNLYQDDVDSLISKWTKLGRGTVKKTRYYLK